MLTGTNLATQIVRRCQMPDLFAWYHNRFRSSRTDVCEMHMFRAIWEFAQSADASVLSCHGTTSWQYRIQSPGCVRTWVQKFSDCAGCWNAQSGDCAQLLVICRLHAQSGALRLRSATCRLHTVTCHLQIAQAICRLRVQSGTLRLRSAICRLRTVTRHLQIAHVQATWFCPELKSSDLHQISDVQVSNLLRVACTQSSRETVAQHPQVTSFTKDPVEHRMFGRNCYHTRFCSWSESR